MRRLKRWFLAGARILIGGSAETKRYCRRVARFGRWGKPLRLVAGALLGPKICMVTPPTCEECALQRLVA